MLLIPFGSYFLTCITRIKANVEYIIYVYMYVTYNVNPHVVYQNLDNPLLDVLRQLLYRKHKKK